MTRSQLNDPAPSPEVEYAWPGSAGYPRATTPHNSSGSQHPALTAAPRSIEGIAEVVRYAARSGLQVLPQATGHGAAGEVGGDTIILDTSGLAEVSIDPAARTARTGAGVTWAAVNAAAQRHGLLGLAGRRRTSASAATPSAAGSAGWCAPRAWPAPPSARWTTLTAVAPSGGPPRTRPTPRTARAVGVPRRWRGRRRRPAQFGLAAVDDLWAGYLLWPVAHLEAVVSAWAAALPRIGPALATSISVLHAPPAPPFPEALRGTPVVHLALASPHGPGQAAALRDALAAVPPPAADTWGAADAARLAGIHLDPPVAVPALGEGRWLDRAPRPSRPAS